MTPRNSDTLGRIQLQLRGKVQPRLARPVADDEIRIDLILWRAGLMPLSPEVLTAALFRLLDLLDEANGRLTPMQDAVGIVDLATSGSLGRKYSQKKAITEAARLCGKSEGSVKQAWRRAKKADGRPAQFELPLEPN